MPTEQYKAVIRERVGRTAYEELRPVWRNKQKRIITKRQPANPPWKTATKTVCATVCVGIN